MAASSQNDLYLYSVLRNYNPAPVPAGLAAGALGPIRMWANKYLAQIQRAGSRAKMTAIKGSADADFLVLLRPETPGTLKEIYESLFARLHGLGLRPRKQNVSIGFSFQGSSVDVVPARLQVGGSGDHSLYVRRGDTWQQTNVLKQINYVLLSGRVNEIRVLKVWRQCQNVAFPSFYLELTTINALWGRSRGTQIARNVADALAYIVGNLVTARVVDPANSNNVISNDLTLAEKQAVASRAKESLRKTWREVIW